MGNNSSHDDADAAQVTVLVRHSKSRANEWQEQNKGSSSLLPAITHEIATQFGLSNAGLCEEGVRANNNHRGVLWKRIQKVAGERRIRIFCSPIRRAIQTVLLSLDCDEAKFMFENGPPKVSLMPLLCEKGSGCENDGIQPAEILADADLELSGKLHGFEKRTLIDLSHFYDHVWREEWRDKWWNEEFRNAVKARAAEFEKMLAWRRETGDWPQRPPEGECVVCFTHWGFAHAVTGVHMANFGKDRTSNPGQLAPEAILIRRDPRSSWSRL